MVSAGRITHSALVMRAASPVIGPAISITAARGRRRVCGSTNVCTTASRPL
jgi:hypothetical protein